MIYTDGTREMTGRLTSDDNTSPKSLESLIERLLKPTHLQWDGTPVHDPMRSEAADALSAALRVTDSLVNKLKAIEKDPSYQGIWGFLHAHNYTYTGPNYKDEVRAIAHWRQTGKERT